jgi:outer membrane protein TolC
VGSATVIELIDSQVALTRSSVEYINALADAHVAEMQLRRARGESF